MYLNLLLKSLKMDTKPERVKAFVRRFVQLLVAAGSGGIEFVAGGFALLVRLAVIFSRAGETRCPPSLFSWIHKSGLLDSPFSGLRGEFEWMFLL